MDFFDYVLFSTTFLVVFIVLLTLKSLVVFLVTEKHSKHTFSSFSNTDPSVTLYKRSPL